MLDPRPRGDDSLRQNNNLIDPALRGFLWPHVYIRARIFCFIVMKFALGEDG